MSGSAQDDAIVGINVTPLVDITLVLLIVFMVTAKLIVSQAMPLDLPKAATGGEVQTVFVIDVDKEARLAVDGRQIAGDDALLDAAKSSLARNAELRTVVQASAQVSHGAVVHVLDVLRRAGIQRIAFGVEPQKPEVSP